MGGFSAGDILFILLVGGVVCGLMVLVSMVRKGPNASPGGNPSDDEPGDH